MSTTIISLVALACGCTLALAMTGEDLLAKDSTARRQVILIDIRMPMERSNPLIVPGFDVLRLSWPTSGNNDGQVKFFRKLRALIKRFRGKQLVLVCGIGQRSMEALSAAPSYGVHSGISQLEGGLQGGPGTVGLLDELNLQN